MAKKHKYTAAVSHNVGEAYVYVGVRHPRFECFHAFESASDAVAFAGCINAAGRLPEGYRQANRWFPKLGVFGGPEQYKHYEAMEAGL